MADRGFRRQRAIANKNGVWEEDTFLDEMMLDWNMPDVARYAACHLDQTEALAATTGHTPGAPLQGGVFHSPKQHLSYITPGSD